MIRCLFGVIAYFLISLNILSAQTPESTPVETTAEVVAEIRTHGNTRTPDDEVVRVSGLQLGQRLDDGTLAEAEVRLKKSGRFDSVEIRKRYRSLEDFSQVALLLVVHERLEFGGNPVTRPLRLIRSHVMFLPILKYDDGYGWTYGVRSSTVDLLGLGERLSVPLSWGATKQATLELERGFERGPLTVVKSSFGVSSRENPRFLVTDHRWELNARAERKIHVLRLGAEAGGTRVRFGSLSERFSTFGGDASIDTRGDPAFPANAVYAFAGWRSLNRNGGQPRIGIVKGDVRGYWRPIRQSVLAARVQYEGADQTLPDYERLLIGGASTLRGTRVGTFVGDRALTASAELRIPITSPLSFARFGATVFFDAAKAYDDGQRSSAVPWSRGAGAGAFMTLRFLSLNVHVARSLDGNGNRLHLSSGFTF